MTAHLYSTMRWRILKPGVKTTILNIDKTKTIYLTLEDYTRWQVSSYKYLGIYKLAQRLHFLYRLRLFGMSTKVMGIFSYAVMESLIRYGMAFWYGSLTVKTKLKIVVIKEYHSLQVKYELQYFIVLVYQRYLLPFQVSLYVYDVQQQHAFSLNIAINQHGWFYAFYRVVNSVLGGSTNTEGEQKERGKSGSEW